MIFKRRTKHYLVLTSTEANLALRALLQFRNKALTCGIDPVDINLLIKKTIPLKTTPGDSSDPPGVIDAISLIPSISTLSLIKNQDSQTIANKSKPIG